MSDEPHADHEPLADLTAALLSASDPWVRKVDLNGSAGSVDDLIDAGMLVRWEVGGSSRLVPSPYGARVLGVVLDEKVDERPAWFYPGDVSKWVRAPREWQTGRHGWLEEVPDAREGPAELAQLAEEAERMTELATNEWGVPLHLLGQWVRAPRPKRGRKPGPKRKAQKR